MSERSSRLGRREEGFALFLSMLLLLVLTILGIALLFTATTEQNLSGNDTKVSKVFYAACSGVDYAVAKLAVDNDYVGGVMPVGVSSHYPGLTGDIQVTITRPINVGYSVHLGDQYESRGSTYESNQIVENYYNFSSTGQGVAIQAAKMVTADVGIYPQQRRIQQ